MTLASDRALVGDTRRDADHVAEGYRRSSAQFVVRMTFACEPATAPGETADCARNRRKLIYSEAPRD